MAKKLTYSSAGVDIDEGARFVDLIKPLVKKTRRPEELGSIGGFGSLFSAGFTGLKDPVLVSGTDGVGTKLKLAFACDRHDSVGIDLVAMCVNDIVTCGAEPLFFLDYIATGKLDALKAREIVKGIAKGASEAGCSLAGGETAEMPGMYKKGEYDLAGFAVGVVERKKIIDGKSVRPGDRIIGLASSGLHSNGYSLARKIFFEKLKLKVSDRPRGLRKSVGAELLTPTRIYVKPVLALTRAFKVGALAHITGGGLTENIPRVLPKGTMAVIKKGSWRVPPIFKFIKETGSIDEFEMMRTFNAGIGMAVVVRKKDEAAVVEALKKMRVPASTIGEIAPLKRGAPRVEYI